MSSITEELGLEGEELEAVQNPESYDFRPEDEDLYSFKPERSLFEEVKVDLANENVEISYSDNGSTDTYVHVFEGENFSLVESHGTEGEIDGYYLVTDDEVLMNNEGSYQKTPNVRPIQVVESADYFLEKVKDGDSELGEDLLED
ncbi:MAG: hypothetical protein ABEK04_03930 [Candidatus Nanohalobium sp.]